MLENYQVKPGRENLRGRKKEAYCKPYSVYCDKKQNSETNIVNLRLLITKKRYHLQK